eukprot:1826243-Amphidinium_carterae.1
MSHSEHRTRKCEKTLERLWVCVSCQDILFACELRGWSLKKVTKHNNDKKGVQKILRRRQAGVCCFGLLLQLQDSTVEPPVCNFPQTSEVLQGDP